CIGRPFIVCADGILTAFLERAIHGFAVSLVVQSFKSNRLSRTVSAIRCLRQADLGKTTLSVAICQSRVRVKSVRILPPGAPDHLSAGLTVIEGLVHTNE